MRADKQLCCEVYGWTKHTFDRNVRDGMPVAERARLAREQADGQAMKNAVARGELLPAEAVVAGWQAAVGHAAASALLRQGCPAHLRLGGEGEPGGEAGEQEPSLRERPVRAVQRRAGARP